MANPLTGERIKNIYTRLLQTTGLSATRVAVRDGSGAASALLLGTDNAAVDNILLDGNTISTLDTDGDLYLTPNGAGQVVISDVDILDGVITSLSSPLGVAYGGTGGTSQATARTGLGLGSLSTQDDDDILVTGGAISGLTSLISAYIRATSSLGYTSGAGSTVTQATSKSTGVTINALCGDIITHNASLGASTSVGFTVTNSEVLAGDVVILSIKSGATANSYFAQADAVADGSFHIHLRNVTGGALGEAITINFAVLRATNS